MSEELPGVSVVVPNYNGAELLPRFAPTWVAAAERYPGPSEVIVVDDGSSDGSRALLGELAGVRAVLHPRNEGFASACRTGVEAAAHELVVLLNSDVAADEGFLLPLVRAFDADEVFSVSPLILDSEGQPSKVTVNLPRLKRGDLRWDGVEPADLLRLARLPADEPLVIYSLFGLGGAIALRRARFLALGGFDPLYQPFYHEDTDLGLCAWRRGWTVKVEPRSQVRHEDGGTINRFHAPFRVKVARRRHRILCGWKHAEGEWRGRYERTLLRRAASKWLAGDLRFYAALWGALRRRGAALAAHRRELGETSVSLAEAFARIRAAWPPPQLGSA